MSLTLQPKSKKELKSRVWVTPLIPTLWRWRQVDLCEIEASQVYTEFQASWGYRKPCLKKTKRKKKLKINKNKTSKKIEVLKTIPKMLLSKDDSLSHHWKQV